MPSPPGNRHRGSIVRQLSLQSQTNRQPVGRKGLKKQLSEDGVASKPVEITGQGWPIGIEKLEASFRLGVNEIGKYGTSKGMTCLRPKPVKLAWGERKSGCSENPTGVEVVARKCQGQPRPLTAKMPRATNLPLLGDKDTLVYTKQQLAERLRVAWREREKHKPNLNIFLTHAAQSARSVNEDTETGRSAGVPEAEVLIRDSVTFRSVSTTESLVSSETKSSGSTGSVTSSTDVHSTRHPRKASLPKAADDVAPIPKGSRDQEGLTLFESAIKEKDNSVVSENMSRMGDPMDGGLDFQTFPLGEPPVKFGNNLTNLELGDIRSKDGNRETEEPFPKGKENLEVSPRSDSGFSECSKSGTPARGEKELICKKDGANGNRSQGTAQERRASFRSGRFLKKAVDEAYSPPILDSGEEDTLPENGDSGLKVYVKKNSEHRPAMTRTFSAPSREDLSQPPCNHPTTKILTRYASSIGLGGLEDVAVRGRVKSAPIRRKLKTAASRRKHREKESDSSGDEKNCRDLSKKKASRRKMASRMGGSEIVTMVSLVSPAASDAEDSVIPLPQDTWTVDEREEGPAVPREDAPRKTVDADTKGISSFIIQKFVALRKSNKTVSFVQHPPMNRSYSVSFPSRRAPAGTPIIVPAPVATTPALTPAQIQEREKRPQPSSPEVSSGTDSRGVKRRLIRTASAPQVKDNLGRSEASDELKATGTCGESGQKRDVGKLVDSSEDEAEKDEPEFKTAKERECWVLYRKMLEKGVTVSFDTVLRGMLTPTEYRLRRNQLLSTC